MKIISIAHFKQGYEVENDKNQFTTMVISQCI